jgi:hypothetical protein
MHRLTSYEMPTKRGRGDQGCPCLIHMAITKMRQARVAPAVTIRGDSVNPHETPGPSYHEDLSNDASTIHLQDISNITSDT